MDAAVKSREVERPAGFGILNSTPRQFELVRANSRGHFNRRRRCADVRDDRTIRLPPLRTRLESCETVTGFWVVSAGRGQECAQLCLGQISRNQEFSLLCGFNHASQGEKPSACWAGLNCAWWPAVGTVISNVADVALIRRALLPGARLRSPRRNPRRHATRVREDWDTEHEGERHRSRI